ncbi:MAG: YceI family protein [Burkholderiales bacterium]|nr:YceI family protein [Anaerolineae bacterium]
MAQFNLDPAHTSVAFSARHMMVTTVRGQFQKASGTLDFDPENPTNASVEVNIDASSLVSGVIDRDNHLRGTDFLDIETYPNITFKSTQIEPTGNDTANIIGDLTIRGMTRPVTIKAEYLGQTNSPFGDVRAGFSGRTKINREDYGLTWNMGLEAGGVLVGKEITIDLDVEAVKVAEPVPAAAV